MKEVVLKPLYHNKQECIGIYFENWPSLNGALRKHAGAKWSTTHKCWYVLLNRENYNKVFFALRGKAVISQGELHHYLAERKKKRSAPKQMEVPSNQNPKVAHSHSVVSNKAVAPVALPTPQKKPFDKFP